ncbi:hypothetical protein V499_02542 [Pseudogymnoascus sp. VKM F-103]|nr:hypothetical protein V499_02542 [Pseudogymnoascus sp. VKM F-103]
MAIKGVGETKLETVSQGDVEVEVVDVAVDIEVIDVAVEVEDEAKPKVHFPTAGGTGGCLIHRNTLRTEPAMMAAVSVGIEGAVEDEMRIVGVMGEGEGKEKGE